MTAPVARARATPPTSGRDAIVLHGAFALVAAIGVATPVGSLGARVTVLVALYHVAIVGVARARQHPEWIRIWAFTAALSVLQILPDAFLGSALGVLSYGDLGVPKVGGVSVFMAGMWTIPLFPVVLAATATEARRGLLAAVVVAAALSLLLLGGAEDPAWALDLWRARHVTTLGHTALYILPAEVGLGVTAFLASRVLERSPRGMGAIAVAATAVMLLFMGTACVAYLVVERPHRGIERDANVG